MPELLYGAFVMNTRSHIQHGQWRHPDAQQADFNDVEVWIRLAFTSSILQDHPFNFAR